jgi:hypothetical protein
MRLTGHIEGLQGIAGMAFSAHLPVKSTKVSAILSIKNG